MIYITNVVATHDPIDVTCSFPLMEPDPDWSFTSDDGTVYRWSFDAEDPVVVPALRFCRSEPMPRYCEECGHRLDDEFDVESWVETPLGERVEPGYRSCENEASRKWIKGPLEWSGTFRVPVADMPLPGETFDLKDCAFDNAEFGETTTTGLVGKAIVTGYDDVELFVGREPVWSSDTPPRDGYARGTFQGTGPVTTS